VKLHLQTTAILVALALATLTGCAQVAPKAKPEATYVPHAGQIRVVTSVAVWADIAQTIGGNAVEATAIVARPNQDPHSYEASVRDQLAVNQADLTIANGAEYDAFFAKLVAAKPNPHIGMQLSLADYVDQKTPNPNPHLWYDLAWVKHLAFVIGTAEALAAPTQQVAQGITARLQAFQAATDVLITTQRKSVKTTVGRGALLTEGFALRMIRNLAMVDHTPVSFLHAVENDQDASAETMQTMRALMVHGRVAVLVLNQQTQGNQTDQLAQWARQYKVPVLRLSELLPDRTHYLEWMTKNLNQIVKAAK